MLSLNEVYNYISSIFDNLDSMPEQSQYLAKTLYRTCVHPNIKSGEFYVVHLRNCLIDGVMTDAVGLFNWVEGFLQVKRLNDAYAQTQNAVALCKNFISTLPDNISKSEKAAMMNRIMEGIKEDEVSIDGLASIAFGSELAASEFTTFRKDNEATHDVCFDNSFQSKKESINSRTVGKLTTIKLDKNFDIKIYGGEQFIEQGDDEEKGMKFSKLFFHEEK